MVLEVLRYIFISNVKQPSLRLNTNGCWRDLAKGHTSISEWNSITISVSRMQQTGAFRNTFSKNNFIVYTDGLKKELNMMREFPYRQIISVREIFGFEDETNHQIKCECTLFSSLKLKILGNYIIDPLEINIIDPLDKNLAPWTGLRGQIKLLNWLGEFETKELLNLYSSLMVKDQASASPQL